MSESQVDTEESMCAELEAWCKREGLPYRSADEIFFDEELQLSPEQAAFLSAYIKRWDVMFHTD